MSEPGAAGGPILELDDVHTYYGAIHALKGISLTVNEGEVVTLIGANGAGKSTTLRSINGLNHPRRGTIRFRGRDITNAAPHGIVKDGIAQSPEGRRLFPRMSVLENLEMGAFQREDRSNLKEDMDRVFDLFETVRHPFFRRRDRDQRRRFGADQIFREPLPSFRVTVLGVIASTLNNHDPVLNSHDIADAGHVLGLD